MNLISGLAPIHQGQTTDEWHSLLHSCSDYLKNAMGAKMYAAELRRVPFLATPELVPTAIVNQLCTRLHTRLFSAGDAVIQPQSPVSSMFIVERGVVICKSHIKKYGESFGLEVRRCRLTSA